MRIELFFADIRYVHMNDFLQTSSEQSAIKEPFKPSFPRAASASHLPLDKQFRAAAVAAANMAVDQDGQLFDGVDDEISQLTLGQDKPSELLSEKSEKPVDFGLPDRGAFSDAHDTQRQEPHSYRKASISTQKDFSLPDVLQQSLSAGNTSSFEPTSAKDSESLSSSAAADESSEK
jgi:hypothetical protein